MHNAPTVTRVQFRAARELDRNAGLLGFLAVEIDDQFAIEGISVRRTTHGELRLSFPERTDSRGGRHTRMRPLRAATWHALEMQVFAELRRQGVDL